MSGYGVQIGDGGGETWESYKPLEAVYTLFNTNSELQNTESIMFKQQDIPFRNWLSKKLQKILMLEGYPAIEYDKKGMYVHGPWGRSRVTELSDGYRRIIQIVVDFFGWQIVGNRIESENDKIIGIILIDELETHLHPQLQRFIVDRLKKHLPNVQFVTTTHSPFVALGTADIDDGSILELDMPMKDGSNNVHYLNVNPIKYRGYTVDQILTSSAFDMEIARGGVTGDKIIRFRELFMKDSRTPDEEIEFKDLQEILDSFNPGHSELEEDRKRQIELKKLLEELNTKRK